MQKGLLKSGKCSSGVSFLQSSHLLPQESNPQHVDIISAEDRGKDTQTLGNNMQSLVNNWPQLLIAVICLFLRHRTRLKTLFFLVLCCPTVENSLN